MLVASDTSRLGSWRQAVEFSDAVFVQWYIRLCFENFDKSSCLGLSIESNLISFEVFRILNPAMSSTGCVLCAALHSDWVQVPPRMLWDMQWGDKDLAYSKHETRRGDVHYVSFRTPS